jgi:hypothetical protein
MPSEDVSVYIEDHTKPVKLCFKCEADCNSVDVAWLDYKGNKQTYATLVPGASYAQSKLPVTAAVATQQQVPTQAMGMGIHCSRTS